MARRLRLKISRIFQSCCSKDTSDVIPSNHVPTTSKPPHKHMKHHVSAALVGHGLRAQEKPTASDDDIGTPKFQWDKEAKWHVVEMTPPRVLGGVPPAPPPTAEKKKRRVKKRKVGRRIRVSTSSADSTLMFSSEGFIENGEEDQETETLVSSKSFSTDTSIDFNFNNMTITEMQANLRRKKKKNVKSRVKPRRSFSSVRMMCRSPPEMASPARLSVFQRMIACTVEGKVRESFAVVKKSEDPYEDFKKSMMEMILEKKMFHDKDLEQLLNCFLSLNSKDHHGVIVKAFSEIWEALFSRRSCSFKVPAAL